MLADGTHDVPPGKVVEVVTHLEMRARPELRPVTLPTGLRIVAAEAPEVGWYRDLFLRVGGQDWLWFSRMALQDAELAEVLADPRTPLFFVEKEGRAEGMLELDFRTEGACELAYFGLSSALIGQGAGRALMNFAIKRAWAQPITRFHVHTCSLDSPQALDFYRRSGFTPTHQQVAISDDPRLTGVLPRNAGPHVPIFD